MKKWIITLSILLSTSAIGSGVVLGKLYKQELRTYEQQLDRALNQESLNNIYVDSDVPIKLEVTEGEPRIEFKSSLTGIVDKEPEYELDVRNEGDKSYITVDAKQIPQMTLFLKEVDILATIYLPRQDINNLSIISNSYYWINGGTNLYYNLEGININNLKVESDVSRINLDGNYKTIDMNIGYGDAVIRSKTPAEVYVSGSSGNIDLKGQYTLIDIDNHGGSINIDSDIPAEVILNTYGGESKLKGKYKDIEIDGSYGDIWVESETECDAFISSSANVELVGAFKNVDMRSDYGDINLITTTQPQRINLLGEYQNISLTLPANIPGFEVTYQKQYEEQEAVYTDFEAKRGVEQKNIDKLYYGDATSKIKLEGSHSNVYILEGKEILNQTNNENE